ncbi:hypothetical protein CRI94_06065 [Longibacter salinarum]|uniref:histidine kinase n=1 Tax=Longibacter salinarum TaxID=1850348 RepID=A0A2A8D113_9BACT|nr:hypothetical protein CRI94_06065 [Longibacter salinarum]
MDVVIPSHTNLDERSRYQESDVGLSASLVARVIVVAATLCFLVLAPDGIEHLGLSMLAMVGLCASAGDDQFDRSGDGVRSGRMTPYPAPGRGVDGESGPSNDDEVTDLDTLSRDELEAALRRERSLSQGIVSSLDGLFVMVNGRGEVLRWNEAFASAAGRDGDRLRGRSLNDLFPEVGRRLDVIVQRAMAEGRATMQAELVGNTGRRAHSLRPHRPVPYVLAATRVVDTEDRVSVTGTRLDEQSAVRQALREHEERYHLIAEHVADVISRHAPDTTCLYASPSTTTLVGYDPEDIVGRRIVDLVHPEDRSTIRKIVSAVLDGEVVIDRLRLRHAKGHYIWVEVTSQLRFDPATGAPLDVIASTRDVTDRVHAEQALQESESRFRQMAENVEGVFFLSTRYEFLYVNPAYESVWRRSTDELHRQPLSFIQPVHPDDRDQVWKALHDLWELEPDESLSTDFRIVYPSGEVRWIRSVCSRVPMSVGPDRFAGYAVDITEQKTQEEATRQSEERWRRLVESHMDPIMISIDGQIRYINPSGAELFGGRPDELIGYDLIDLVEPSFREEVTKRAANVYAGQNTEPFEHRVRRLDGDVRIVVAQSVAIQYDGQPAAQTVVRDVTDWRRAQSKLEYRVLMENLIVDLSTRLIDTGSEITDETIENALGRIGPFVGADRSYVFLASEDGTDFHYVYEWCAPGISAQKETAPHVPVEKYPWFHEQLSQMRPVHIPRVNELPPEAGAFRRLLEPQNIESLVVVPMTDGNRLAGFVGFDAVQQARSWEEETIMLLRVLGDTFANSLARMETEQALREREAQYRSVVENVRDIVFQTDTHGRWTFLNPAWEDATGFSVEESLGQHFDEQIESEYLEEGNDTVSILMGEEEGRYEVKLHGRKGTRWMALFAQALYDEDGNRSGVAGTLHDITERKEMERKTREALQRERELNKLKSSFVSMVSHEFRTPLSTIRSSSEMIARFIEQEQDEKRDKYLSRIRRQVDRMTRLLGDVITTSKLDAQNNGPDLYPTDLRYFMREIGEEMRSHFGQNRQLNIQWSNIPDRLPVDRDLLHHIAGNLISNALKYSPDDEPVVVNLAVEDECLLVRVRDRGIGIQAADEPHLFQAFYRGENVGKKEGVGLGMTIVRRAIDVYGGNISWADAPGGGTTFVVELPLAEEPESGSRSDSEKHEMSTPECEDGKQEVD